MFCAINLFSTSAEPLTVTPLSSKQLLRAAGLPHDHAEVFEVEHVAGIAESLQSAREYYPYYALESLQPDHGHYSLDRISSPIHGATDTYLATIASTQTGMHLTDATREETLSIDLRCTNRHLPAELRAGDIRLPGRNYTASLGCRNIIPVSTPGRGPVGAALHWRIVAHLTLSKMAFTRIETLRGTLSLYNLQMLHDGPTGRSNQAKIESIRDVCATAGTIIVRGVPTRGMRVKLSIDENRFASRGEAFLFGKLLQTIYAQQTGVNSWTQGDMQLHASATTYSWEPSLASASAGPIT